jgi:hypothetical protein
MRKEFMAKAIDEIAVDGGEPQAFRLRRTGWKAGADWAIATGEQKSLGIMTTWLT